MSNPGIIFSPYIMNVFDSTETYEKLILRGKIESLFEDLISEENNDCLKIKVLPSYRITENLING